MWVLTVEEVPLVKGATASPAKPKRKPGETFFSANPKPNMEVTSQAKPKHKPSTSHRQSVPPLDSSEDVTLPLVSDKDFVTSPPDLSEDVFILFSESGEAVVTLHS